MLFHWIETKWAEVSTKIGLVLGALSSTIPVYVGANPKLAYLGIGVAALLVIWNEKPRA